MKLMASYTEQSPGHLSPWAHRSCCSSGQCWRCRTILDAIGNEARELPAVLLLAVMPGRVLQQEFPSGGDSDLVCPVSVPSWWTVGFALLSQGAQCLVLQLLWEVGVGYSAEARWCLSQEVYHRQLVFWTLQRTSINLQRFQFTVLGKHLP